jgi:hypothetical protein
MKKSADYVLRRFTVSVFFVFLCSIFQAHDSYFSFAEIEYIAEKSKVEITLVITAHDFEDYLLKSKKISSTLDNAFTDSLETNLICDEIKNHFILKSALTSTNVATKAFKLINEGYQLLLNGNIEFYFSAGDVSIQNGISIQFDLMMDYFPLQQNKITFTYLDKKRTCVFLTNSRNQFIEIN